VIIGVAVIALVLFLAGSAQASSSSISSTPEEIQPLIRRVASARGVDPALMLAFAKKETNFNPAAVNASDPSYGLFQIMPFWLQYFGFSTDPDQLMNAEFNTGLACDIVGYFQQKGFRFPDQADIYNVGETLWKDGRRNVSYRNDVIRFYGEFSKS
jgi:soluble lytic murein transglycosylase-like protein